MQEVYTSAVTSITLWSQYKSFLAQPHFVFRHMRELVDGFNRALLSLETWSTLETVIQENVWFGYQSNPNYLKDLNIGSALWTPI